MCLISADIPITGGREAESANKIRTLKEDSAMKVKGLLSTFFALAISAGFCTGAMAEGAYVSDADAIKFTVTSDVAQKADIIVADYDRDGYLISSTVNTVDISAGENEYTYQQLGVGANCLLAEGVYSNRKVLLWEEGSMKPINSKQAVDTIKIDPSEYIVAVVSYIDYYNGKPYIIELYHPDDKAGADLLIKNNKTYNISYNGDIIDISKIRVGDVLCIEIKDKDKEFSDWDTYNITVSRNNVIGKILSFDDKICVMEDGSEYWCICDMPPIQKDFLYRLNFDMFGRVVSCSEVIDQNSPMAVFVSSIENKLTAYVDGELKSFEAKKEFLMEPGDAFFFRENEDGIVTSVERMLTNSIPETYTDLYNMVLEDELCRSWYTSYMFGKFSTDAFNDDTLVFGAIVDYSDRCVIVATNETITDINAVNIDRDTVEYDLADDVTVYEYDYEISALKKKDRISTAGESIFNYTIPKGAFIDEDQCEDINFMSNLLLSENNPDYGKIRFAVLKVVDDEVTEALVFRPSSEKG